MTYEGVFKGWIAQRAFGFIRLLDGTPDVFLHMAQTDDPLKIRAGSRLSFFIEQDSQGRFATQINILEEPNFPKIQFPLTDTSVAVATASNFVDAVLESDDVENLNTGKVANNLLAEIARWKRDAKGEDNTRYFWNVKEVERISDGDKYFVIGRKGCGKTAICEHFSRLTAHNVFAEKLSFKSFPFNELYEHTNKKFTIPNQFITIWKYLIYSSACRLMLKNQAVDEGIRDQLSILYEDKTALSRRIGRWVSKEFGFSLFGLSLKMKQETEKQDPTNWTERVDFLEDVLLQHAGDSTYYILFDELDEDYRDIVGKEKHDLYTALITSLFKAVQDIRSTFSGRGGPRLFPVVFLRDDIYDLIQDADKNKWGDFRLDLTWDNERAKRLIAFRISRAINPLCAESLSFEDAWGKVFGTKQIGVGTNSKTRISTFEFICRSTLVRPRDFVLYLQNCAEYAIDSNVRIEPAVVRYVDKAFSNYLRQELTDELFAVLPDIVNIFDTISQLRKWNFSIAEFEYAYSSRVEQGFIQEKNVKFVLQVLYLFSVIGNTPRVGRYVFRYQNREARLNFNERVVVHRGLFKALQIL